GRWAAEERCWPPCCCWRRLRPGCKAPEHFSFAMPTNPIDQSEFPVGTSLKYECRPGYYRRRFSITCQNTLVWTSAENFCKRKSCQTPSDPVNGIVTIASDTNFGSRISYSCNRGHRLVGSPSAVCMLSGNNVFYFWQGEVLKIEPRVSCVKHTIYREATHSALRFYILIGVNL
uniref:Complement receptor-related protein n=1 Tax=Cavia porcellus TaxID=10141 RepID=H0W611_CAVPO